MAQTPVFLDRDRYRRRRLIDAARLLPVLGVILLMVPLLWPIERQAPETPMSLSSAGLYIFAAWLGLIALCGFVSHLIRQVEPDTAVDP